MREEEVMENVWRSKVEIVKLGRGASGDRMETRIRRPEGFGEYDDPWQHATSCVGSFL